MNVPPKPPNKPGGHWEYGLGPNLRPGWKWVPNPKVRKVRYHKARNLGERVIDRSSSGAGGGGGSGTSTNNTTIVVGSTGTAARKTGTTTERKIAGSFPGLPHDFRAGITSIQFAVLPGFHNQRVSAANAAGYIEVKPNSTNAALLKKWDELMHAPLNFSEPYDDPMPGVIYAVKAVLEAPTGDPTVQGVLITWTKPDDWEWVDNAPDPTPIEIVCNPMPVVRLCRAPQELISNYYPFTATVTRIFAISPIALRAGAEGAATDDNP